MFVVLALAIVACSKPVPTTVPTPTMTRTATVGDSVMVHYTGTMDSGEEFDSSRGREPLGFVLGDGRMISGFDAAVRGMRVGDSVTVRLELQDAYGERLDRLVLEYPIDQLPPGLGEGDGVQYENGFTGVIIEVTAETFTVDANHRLAGQALTFEIELASVN